MTKFAGDDTLKNGKVQYGIDKGQDYEYPQHHHPGMTEDNGALYQEIDVQSAGMQVSPAVPPRKETSFYSVIEEDHDSNDYSLIGPEYHILEDKQTKCFDSEYYACPDTEKYMVGM